VSLLVVGSVAYDALESPYGKVERTLGGAATYFSVSAAFFTHVKLVAIVGDDFDPKDETMLSQRKMKRSFPAGTSIREGWSGPTGRRFSGRDAIRKISTNALRSLRT
jgi:hypothetical protein